MHVYTHTHTHAHTHIYRYHRLYVQFAIADAGVAALNFVKVLVFVVSKVYWAIIPNGQESWWFSKTIVTIHQTQCHYLKDQCPKLHCFTKPKFSVTAIWPNKIRYLKEVQSVPHNYTTFLFFFRYFYSFGHLNRFPRP